MRPNPTFEETGSGLSFCLSSSTVGRHPLFLEGEMDLQGVVETGVGQQGGSLHPLINLFNMQTLYGRIDGNEVEVVRICPHLRKEISTIEYMVHQSHTEDVDMAIARRKEDIPYFRDERSRLSHAVAH